MTKEGGRPEAFRAVLDALPVAAGDVPAGPVFAFLVTCEIYANENRQCHIPCQDKGEGDRNQGSRKTELFFFFGAGIHCFRS